MAETLDSKLLTVEGQKAYQAGKYAEAASTYAQASRAFTASGKTLEAAEASNNQSVAHLQTGDAAAALQAAEGTDAIFAKAGDKRRQGMALANQAAALYELNRLDESLTRYIQASDLLKQTGDTEMRAAILKNISTLQLRTGKQLQALATMDAALDNQSHLSLRERLLHKLLRVPMNMLNRR